LKHSLFITLGIFIAVAVLLNVLIDNPTFDNLTAKADFEIQSNEPDVAEKTLIQILKQDPYNIENHYRYISTHYEIPERKKVGKRRYQYRDDHTIYAYYDSLTQSADPRLADLGNYGNGLIASLSDDYVLAINHYLHVKNRNLVHFNNSIGYAYTKVGSLEEAETSFRKEIEIDGNLAGAYANLARLLFEQDRIKEVEVFLTDQEIKKYIPAKIERSIYFEDFKFFRYTVAIFRGVFSGFNILGFIAAFLIMASWTIYLRKLDIFEVEKWQHIIITVILGMVFSLITYPLSDFDNLIFGFKLNGGLINDFLYSVIGIGAIEEFVKIIPLLLMLRFTKAVNEPFDYIKYASLSALGFAFIENLIYFDENSLQIMHGRALTSVVSHMFDSSIIAYGLILNKYKRRRNRALNFIAFFTLASLAHGFYDFWLINKSASAFSIFTAIFLLVSMFIWNSFKNNALNHSVFFDEDKSLDNKKLQDYLLYSLTGVLLFEYIALTLKFSPAVANHELISSLYSGTYLIMFLSGNLGNFSLSKGEWKPINYFTLEKRESLVGTEIKINRFTDNDYANIFLPNTGKVIKKLKVSKEPDWYLVKIDNPQELTSFLHDTVIIRTKDQSEYIQVDHQTMIAFYIIPSQTNLAAKELNRADFTFCGWAVAEQLSPKPN